MVKYVLLAVAGLALCALAGALISYGMHGTGQSAAYGAGIGMVAPFGIVGTFFLLGGEVSYTPPKKGE